MPEPDPLAKRPLRLAHLTTVDMSLALLLGTELAVDVEEGHIVFGISAPGPYVERVEALGVTHVPVTSFTRSWSLVSDLKAFIELFRTLRRLDLDVVHTHTPKAGVMGRIAGRLAGVPVVVNTCHGLWARSEDRLLKRAFVYGLEALAIRFADFELFQNAQDAHTLRRFLKKGRWKVVGNGIDLDRFTPDPEGRARIRAEWGIPDGQVVVGSIGRRVREKGLSEFAEAANALRGTAAFVWVGPDDDTDAGATVPHQDAIHFVGEYTDMPAVYSALDIFVLASYREGFSRASMEAAAVGKPMVLSDIRGCREVGEDGVHLLLSPVKDGHTLTGKIQQLLDQPSVARRLAAAARERAQQAFDQRQIARTSLDVYASVAGRPRGSGDIDHRTTVLHVLPQDLDRGAQNFAAGLRDRLAGDSGQRHMIVALFASGQAAINPDIRFEIPRGRLSRVLDPRAVLALRRAARSQNAQVLVAHGGEALKYVVAAANRSAITIYKRTGLSSAEVNRPTRRVLYKFLSRRVTHTVGVSQALIDQSTSLHGVDPAQLTLIPNGRDPDKYRPPESPPVRQAPVVLWVGQFERGKRPELFLDVVEVLRQRNMRFEAVMIGDGPLRNSLEERAKDLAVSLLGVRRDVPAKLREADLLIMTSEPQSEGLPGVLVEAGLSGLPVVTTQAAGAADVVAHGKTGFVVASGGAAALAERVEHLLSDASLRRSFGAAARERCASEFTMQAAADRWHALVDKLLLNSTAAGARTGAPGRQ